MIPTHRYNHIEMDEEPSFNYMVHDDYDMHQFYTHENLQEDIQSLLHQMYLAESHVQQATQHLMHKSESRNGQVLNPAHEFHSEGYHAHFRSNTGRLQTPFVVPLNMGAPTFIPGVRRGTGRNRAHRSRNIHSRPSSRASTRLGHTHEDHHSEVHEGSVQSHQERHVAEHEQHSQKSTAAPRMVRPSYVAGNGAGSTPTHSSMPKAHPSEPTPFMAGSGLPAEAYEHCPLGEANHGVPQQPNLYNVSPDPDLSHTFRQGNHHRLKQPMQPSKPVPEARFRPSHLDTITILRESPFFRLPHTIREKIWSYVFHDPSLFHYMCTSPIDFEGTSGITNLPALCLTPKSVVRLLNTFIASKTWYQDSTSVWFSKYFPHMVTEVHEIIDYEILEKYVLWECPDHFVRFSWTSPLPKISTLAIHKLQLRSVAVKWTEDSLHFTSKFRNNGGMQDAIMAEGFFPAHVHEKPYDANGLPFAHRPPLEAMLSHVVADGQIGSLFWWIHAWFNKVLWNRTHWPIMSALLTDFSQSMRHWVETNGPMSGRDFRFGCVVTYVRKYQFELERKRCWALANIVLQQWKERTEI